MSMQTFYNGLQNGGNGSSDPMPLLAALTHLPQEALDPLRSDLGWEDWYATSDSDVTPTDRGTAPRS